MIFRSYARGALEVCDVDLAIERFSDRKEPSDGLEPSTPSFTMRSFPQPVATHGNRFGLLLRL